MANVVVGDFFCAFDYFRLNIFRCANGAICVVMYLFCSFYYDCACKAGFDYAWDLFLFG